ncbi:GntR family transcriptional regulator [Sphingobium sp. AP49]|uniref:GntR family transcriptional regulator n=1 Tax=Sphingobium sp. AP49 TaxID=1144307 RepID=UPI00026ED798|nr:GntR family transcriptional regulator [Sphingobium sp. AP49]WHO39407.1 GntR family transcriptional regulator [Sphingobium sp. AP49]
MSPAHVLEPTYDALRRRLIAGTWPSGFRLEATKLALDLGVSITPVRDSLNRLSGERLVQATAGIGFHVPRLDAADINQLLDWHEMLLSVGLRRIETGEAQLDIPHGHNGIADHSAILFGSIGMAAGNGELDRAIANAAARLGPYRRMEADLLAGAAAEIDEIDQTARAGSWESLTHLLQQYHARRRAIAPHLAHAVREN